MKRLFRPLWRKIKAGQADFIYFIDRTEIAFSALRPITKTLPQSDFLVATVVNNDFLPYFEMLFKSLRYWNPEFDAPWIVFHSNNLCPLSKKKRDRLARMYKNFQFYEIDETPYLRLAGETPSHMVPALFSLECFGLDMCNRVIFLDADMLVLGNLDGLFDIQAPFAACLPGHNLARKNLLAGHRLINRGVNTGVMVISKPYLDRKVLETMLTYPSGQVADQDVINRFFRFRKVKYLPHELNCHAEFFWDDAQRDPSVRILHYAGLKPLQAPDLPRMNIWYEYWQQLIT